MRLPCLSALLVILTSVHGKSTVTACVDVRKHEHSDHRDTLKIPCSTKIPVSLFALFVAAKRRLIRLVEVVNKNLRSQ